MIINADAVVLIAGNIMHNAKPSLSLAILPKTRLRSID